MLDELVLQASGPSVPTAVRQIAEIVPGFQIHHSSRNRHARADDGSTSASAGARSDTDRADRSSPEGHEQADASARIKNRFCLLENLDREHAQACIARMSLVEYSAGDKILEQGDLSTAMVRDLCICADWR